MKKLLIEKTKDGFMIASLMTGCAGAQTNYASFPSEQALEVGIQAHGFTESDVKDAIKTLQETGEVELVLPNDALVDCPPF
jgi:hypothetical protein